MVQIGVRAANMDDALSMSIIHANSWKNAYEDLLPNKYLKEIKDDQWVNMIRNGLKDNKMKAWIASIKSQNIACVCIGGSRYPNYEGQMELISIYVLPEYWNLGAGSLLMNKVLEYAANNNYNEVGLWVLEGNNHAIRFYEKLEFISNEDTMSSIIGNTTIVEKRYIKKLG